MNKINLRQSMTLNDRHAIPMHHNTLECSHDVGVVGKHDILNKSKNECHQYNKTQSNPLN